MQQGLPSQLGLILIGHYRLPYPVQRIVLGHLLLRNPLCYNDLRRGETSSDFTHSLYLFAVVGLSHHLSVSQGLVSQAVFKLAPC